jgi:prolyl oligopeptidase
MMRRWGYHLSAAAAVLALAACSPSEETNMTDTEESGVTDTADLPGAQLNVAIQAETESLEWLEDVEGERALAFATEHERAVARSPAPLIRAMRTLYNQRAWKCCNPPTASLMWACAAASCGISGATPNTQGLWRKTSVESYATDNPEWDVVLDLDALGEEEGQNWVWRGADCLAPDYTRCMITLSDGGSDAAVRREWDMETREFVEDGFVIDETKGSTAWIDADTLLIATALDPAEATQSGYPFVVKRWSAARRSKRRRPWSSPAPRTMSASGRPASNADGTAYMMAIQAESFFESVYWYLPDGATGEPVQMPLPRKSRPQALFDGQLVFSIEEDWTPVEGGETYPTGSILSFDMGEFVETGELPAVKSCSPPMSASPLMASPPRRTIC